MSTSKFSRMDLTWFGNKVTDDPEPDIEGEDEFDIVTVDNLDDPDPDEASGEEEQKITMSPEEFQELKKKGDSAAALQQGISELGNVLNKPQPRQELPEQRPGESDEDFKKRFNQELFGDNPSDVLDEYFNRKLGPLMQQVGGITSEQAKELLMVKDDTKKYFNRYKDDIEEYHDSLPAAQKSNPRSWRYAYDEVLKQKRDDIVEHEVQERFDEMFAKKMEEMGMSQEGSVQGGRSKGVYSEGAGMVGYNVKGTGGNKKKKAKITKEEMEYCDRRGMEYEDFLLARGRID